jgi:hypothetical protein
MARPLRTLFPDAYYHATSRGNERKAIFRDDTDRSVFSRQAQGDLTPMSHFSSGNPPFLATIHDCDNSFQDGPILDSNPSPVSVEVEQF